MIAIVLMYALFASSFSMGKVLLSYATPLFITGTRMLISGLLLLGYEYFWAHEHFRLERRHIWLFIQLIFFGVFANYLLRGWALYYLPSSKTSFFYNLSPFASSLYSYLLFKERMTRKQWAGLVIGCIGLIPMLMSTSLAEAGLSEIFYISWPEVAVILSVAFTSYGWIVLRKLVRFHHYRPTMVNGVSMTSGGLLALLFTPLIDGRTAVTNISSFCFWLVAIILISNLLCHNLYGHLLKQYTATFLSFAGFLMPLFASLYGALFLGETITWHFYVSGVIVFIGLVLFYKDELMQSSKEQLEPAP